MKYNDFKMTDYSLNVRSDSKFFNRENMSAVSKTVTYFNNYFINPGILARLESNDMIFDYSIPSDLVDRMDTFAKFIYDEKPDYGYGAYSGSSYKLDKRDSNITILKVIVATKLLLAYTSGNVRKQPIDNLDMYFSKVFYKIVYAFDAFDVIDSIVYYRGKKDISDNNIEESKQNMVTVNEWKNKDIKPDYDYNRNKETALITAIIRTNINCYSRNNNLPLIVGEKYSGYLNIVEDMNPFVNDFRFIDKLKLFNLITDMKTETICNNIDSEEKSVIIEKIDSILKDGVFDNVTKFKEINKALTYGGYRPDTDCKKLMDRYIGDYKYTGVVYHGFYNGTGAPDVLSVLRHYDGGYISCSKDLRTAKNFARGGGSECNMFGGILEIYIDEDIEAIDIEKILQDAYDKEKTIYRNLYNSFINEKEVLIKMPIKKYRLLTPVDVNRILGDEQYLQEYKPLDKKPPEVNNI